MSPTQLRCEYAHNPVGLQVSRTPRLFWRLDSSRPGARQSAYHIRVASSPELLSAPDLWDSGRVESDATTFIEYGGSPHGAQQKAFWQVQVWDNEGADAQSEIASWEMGIENFDAQWIGGSLRGGPETPVPAPFLRREFALDKPVKSARLYATARGVYECELNGMRVGDQIFAPGWTDYSKRLQVQTYDVTDLLQNGTNAWGAALGDGWYCGRVGWHGRQHYGLAPQFLAQLEIEFEDGQTLRIATDASWTHAYGPILASDMQDGEAYDARQEFGDWSRAGFDAGAWHPVQTEEISDAQALSVALAPPVRRTQEIAPARPAFRGWEGAPWVFDMGQNMVGRVRLKVSGEAGQTIRLRFAETLEGGPTATEGHIYTTNLRRAQQTDTYTLKGGGEEIWEPRFTFHGFRYVEVNGLTGEPAPDTLTGVVLHSDLERIGDFECSDDLINQLQRNIDWGWRGNSVDVPTDCPQRDERLGWMGDAQVFAPTAAFNRDVSAFFSDFADKTTDAQDKDGAIPCVVPTFDAMGPTPGIQEGGPAWAEAVLVCPWTVYRTTGDTRILSAHYDSFQKFFEFQSATAQDGVRCYEGYEGWMGYGDWLALDGPTETYNPDDPSIGSTVWGNTPRTFIGAAFFAFDALMLARIAEVIGKTEDAAHYRARFEELKTSFIEKFIAPDGTTQSGTQTSYLLGLQFDLLPESARERAAQELVKDIRARSNRLSAGFVASSYVNHVLSAMGHEDVAFGLLFQTKWPSWLYAVTRNATTIWERWDGWTEEKGFQDVGMNSFNHYAYGAIGSWLYEVVAGIALDDEVPGYKQFKLAPRPGGSLTSAKAHLDTLHGRIESEWHLENGNFSYRFVVPPNTRAHVSLPNGDTFAAEPGEHTGQVAHS